MDYALSCNILSCNQFGFIRGKSTQDAVISLTQRIYECFNENSVSFCANVFVDFQKFFDTIGHSILFKKLKLYGVTGIPLSLIENYFSDRTQSVRVGTHFSSAKPIIKGVPQGSILGPLMFLFFINDISNISNKFTTVLFADDTTISFKCRNIAEFNSLSNAEMHKFFLWAAANKLSLNLNKTFYIIHSFRSFNDETPSLKINDHSPCHQQLRTGFILGN